MAQEFFYQSCKEISDIFKKYKIVSKNIFIKFINISIFLYIKPNKDTNEKIINALKYDLQVFANKFYATFNVSIYYNLNRDNKNHLNHHSISFERFINDGLFLAISKTSLSFMETLVRCNADINYQETHHKKSALHLIVDKLIELYTTLNSKKIDHENILMQMQNLQDILNFLLAQGINTTLTCSQGKSALQHLYIVTAKAIKGINRKTDPQAKHILRDAKILLKQADSITYKEHLGVCK